MARASGPFRLNRQFPKSVCGAGGSVIARCSGIETARMVLYALQGNEAMIAELTLTASLLDALASQKHALEPEMLNALAARTKSIHQTLKELKL